MSWFNLSGSTKFKDTFFHKSIFVDFYKITDFSKSSHGKSLEATGLIESDCPKG